MNEWIKLHEKIALIYKDNSWTYKELIEVATSYQPQYIRSNQVVVCAESDPLQQILTILYGLLNDKPVYFGQEEAVERVENQTLPKDTFLIATSSGTTGRKKWIYKKKSQWLDSFKVHGDFFNITNKDRLFVNGSLSYTANLYSVLHMFYTGGSVVLSSDKKANKWIESMENHQATIAFLVPSKLDLLLKTLKGKWLHEIAITTAGESLKAHMMTSVLDKCPNMKVHHYYGAAEVGHISAIRHDMLIKHPKSVGLPFNGIEVLIEDGIIYAKSPYGQTLGQSFESAYDYGFIDHNGYLYVTGRTDTQMNVHGRKFDARDVVQKIKDSQGVLDCLFIQLDDMNRHYGLYIVVEERETDQIQKRLDALLTEDLPRWQWPKTKKIVTKGIYSETGKYDMVRIRGLFS